MLIDLPPLPENSPPYLGSAHVKVTLPARLRTLQRLLPHSWSLGISSWGDLLKWLRWFIAVEDVSGCAVERDGQLSLVATIEDHTVAVALDIQHKRCDHLPQEMGLPQLAERVRILKELERSTIRERFPKVDLEDMILTHPNVDITTSFTKKELRHIEELVSIVSTHDQGKELLASMLGIDW